MAMPPKLPGLCQVPGSLFQVPMEACNCSAMAEELTKKTKKKKKKMMQPPQQQQPVVEEDSWADLPNQLLAIVLAPLPMIEVLPLQTVCKSWRSVILSPDYSQLQSLAHHSSESWLVMQRPSFWRIEDFVAYCPTSGRWFKFPLDLHMLPYPVSYWCSLRSAGGLICCLIEDHGHPGFTVLVYDILRRKSKKLPSPPGRYGLWNVSIDMVANSATGSYQVILSNPERRYEYLEVYDSRSGRWKRGQDIHSGNFDGTVLNGGLFEFIEDVGTLAAYNGELDTWSKVKAPEPTCLFEGGSLDLVRKVVIKCKERLLLLAGLVSTTVLQDVRSIEQIPIQGFGVWELQYLSHDTASWVEVARTPTEYWKGLYRYGRSDRFSCKFHIANENLICMTGLVYAKGDKKIHWLPLVYDLTLDSWHRLPGRDDNDSMDYLGAFTFYPKLNAMI